MAAFRHNASNSCTGEQHEAQRKVGCQNGTTAAALIVTGAVLIGSASATEIKGRCFGVNSCKDQGECKSSVNDCKGKNACKGQGWLGMLQLECTNSNGRWETI